MVYGELLNILKIHGAKTCIDRGIGGIMGESISFTEEKVDTKNVKQKSQHNPIINFINRNKWSSENEVLTR